MLKPLLVKVVKAKDESLWRLTTMFYPNAQTAGNLPIDRKHPSKCI